MKSKTIAGIKKLLEEGQLGEENIAQLRSDPRKGIQNLLRSYDKRQAEHLELKKRFQKMNQIEESLYDRGVNFIAGTDEAGRGPLAGPLVAASLILPKNFSVFGITDSKQLTQEQRAYFFNIIKEEAIDYSIYYIDNKTIDQINILEATKKGMKNSLLQLKQKPDFALIDAVELGAFPIPRKSLIKGDERSISIAAASILAKVSRDKKMLEIAREYPGYGFEKHKGYGTREHLDALERLGPTPYHRTSFAPVKNLIK